MARKANIRGVIADAWGDAWDWTSAHPLSNGITCYKGWPNGRPRGKGGCGPPAWIVTPELAKLYHSFRSRECEPMMSSLDAPFASGVIKRHRSLLGITASGVAEAWWIEREADVRTLSLAEFAAKHNASKGSVQIWRAKFGISQKLGEKHWWLEPSAIETIGADMPLSWIADKLKLSVGRLRVLRWNLRLQGHEIRDLRCSKPPQ